MPTLKDLRERAMLSQTEVARACGVIIQAVSQWEHGRTRPTPANQRKLVSLYHCTPDELLAALRETRAAREGRGKAENERPAA